MDRPSRPWAGLILLGLVLSIALLPLLSLESELFNRVCPTSLCFLAPQRFMPFTVAAGLRGAIISPWWPIGYWLVGIAGFGWVLRKAPLRLIGLSTVAMLLIWPALAQLLIQLAGWHFFYDGP